MIAGIVSAFYLAGIVLAIHAIMTTRTAPGAVAWSVSLVTMPFVAVPAYLVLGRSKFEGGLQAFEQRKDEIETSLAEFRRGLEPWQVSPRELRENYAAVRNLVKLEMTRGNRVDLLINGEATFDSIISGCRAGAGVRAVPGLYVS